MYPKKNSVMTRNWMLPKNPKHLKLITRHFGIFTHGPYNNMNECFTIIFVYGAYKHNGVCRNPETKEQIVYDSTRVQKQTACTE
jgi:hypothetical protein